MTLHFSVRSYVINVQIQCMKGFHQYNQLSNLWLRTFCITVIFTYCEQIRFILKACVRYFSLFLKEKCISSLFRTKHIEKKFNLQLFFLSTASQTFILSRATTRHPPPWNFSFRKNNCMCNRDNPRDVAACPDE